MVSVVSGSGLGLVNTSRGVAGANGEWGQAVQGRAGERITVNAANGNLVIQNQDGQLAGIGADIALLRTYNSQGGWDGDNGDAWRLGYYRRIGSLTGTLNAAGSTLKRTDADGFESTYTYRDGRYISTDGAGAYDSLLVVGSTATWTDGDTGVTETYAEATAGTYRLTQITDPDGHAVKLGYDSQGLITSVSTWKAGATSADETLTLAYDASRRLTQVSSATRRADGTLAAQTRNHYTYDSAGRLSGVVTDLSPEDNSTVDGRSYSVAYTYDGAGRVRTVTQTDGTALTIDYDDAGRVRKITDALGHATSFGYDTAARQTTVTDALNQVARLGYDSAGRLGELSGTGFKTTFAYDADGNLLSSRNGLDQQTLFGYDGNGNLVRSTDASGRVLERSFDAANRLTGETQYAQAGAALTTRYVYDTTGGLRRLRFAISAEGRVTEQQYNSLGQVSSSLAYTRSVYGGAATLADLAAWAAQQSGPQRVDYSHDLRGQLASRTDAAGLTRYTYDAFGRLLQSIDASGNTTAYLYDGLDRLTLSTDALGVATVTSYDDAGYRTSVQLANGLRSVSTYNTAGLLVAQAQFNGSTALGETRYVYDAANRLRMTQDPTGQRQWMLYDEAGRKVGDVDALGHLNETRYDAAGRLVQSIGYEQAVNTALLLDAQGQPANVSLATIRPATSATDRRQWQIFDAAGRLTHQVHSLGEVTETQYDGAGRITTVIQHGQRLAALSPAGSSDLPVLAYASTGDPDRTTRNLYDADGLLRGTLDAEGYLTENRYDAAGHLVERIAYATATDPAQRSAGTLAQLTPAAHSSDRRSVWLYDNQGRVQAEIDPDGWLTETTYNAAGQRTQSLRYARRIAGTASPASTLATLRPASSPQDQGIRWTYDALNRVLTETAADGTVTRYGYDTVGNLISTERAAGTAEVRSRTARYDVQGRLTAELSAEGTARLAQAGTQEQIDAVWSTYATQHAYDAAGRRIRSTDARGSTTVFYYDAAGRLAYRILKSPQGGEVQASRYTAFSETAQTTRYSRRLSLADTAALNGGLADAALDGKIAALADDSDHRTQAHYNQRGLIQQAIDALGFKTDYSYNAFGQLSRSEAAAGSLGDGRVLRTDHAYDRRGLQTRNTQDALGLNVQTQAEYDAFGRQTASVDARGYRSTTRYLASDGNPDSGRQVIVTDATGASRSTTYDAFDRVVRQTDALGQSITFSHDTANRRMTMTSALGIQTVTQYSRHGQVVQVTDGTGAVTRYDYDRNGNLLTSTDALGNVTSSSYDRGDNRVTLSMPGNSGTNRYEYDAANRLLVQTVDPDGLRLKTSYEYDGQGRAVTITDPAGTVTRHAFNGRGELREVTVDDQTGGLQLKTRYAYDAQGRVLGVTEGAGTAAAKTREYRYDLLGRRTQEVVDPAGLRLTTAYEYDAAGNVLSRRDAVGAVTRYAYDAAGRQTHVMDALGAVTEQRYDAAGRVVETIRYAKPIGRNLINLPYVADPRIQAAPSEAAGLPAGETVYLATDRDGFVGDWFAVKEGEQIDLSVEALGEKVSPSSLFGIGLYYSVDGVNFNAFNRAATLSNNGSTGGIVAGRLTVPAGYKYALVMVQLEGPWGQTGSRYFRNVEATRVGNTADLIPAKADLTTLVKQQLLSSAADQHTRYAYDAAGRQTHVMGALGAVTEQRYDAAGRVVETIRYARPIGRNLVNLPYAADSRIQAAPSEAAGLPAGETVYLATDRDGFVGDWFAVKEGEQIDLSVEALAEKVSPSSLFGIGLYYSVDGVNFNAFNRAATLSNNGSTGGIVAGRLTVPAGYKYARVMVQLEGPWGQTGSRYFRNVEATRVNANPSADPLTGELDLATLVKQQLLSSAADQHTRYAYDAAGRQTHVMDALGAVTEQRYDAAGRVVETIRYAKPIGRNLVNLPYVADSRIQAAPSGVAGLPAGETVYLATDRDGFVGDWFSVKDGEQIDLSVEALGEKVSPSSLFGIGLYYSVDGVNFNAFNRAATLSNNGSTGGIVAGRLTVPAGYKYARVMVQLEGPWGQTGSRYFRNVEATRVGNTADLIPPKADLATLVKQQLLSSAADQHTRYAYDAAGRQTHVMDALGAVTEQRYDAAGRVVETIRYARPIGRNLVNLPYVADSRIQAAPSEAAGLPAGETVYLATDRDGFVGDWFAVKEGEQIDLSVEALGEKVSPSSLFGIGLYYSVDGVNFNAFNRAATLSNNGSTGGIVAGRLTVPAGYKYARVMVQLEGPWGQTGSRYFRNVEATRVGNTADLIPAKADLATLVKQQLLSSAADQHTRYAYDAAGRQTHVMDALGAVTEQRYDTAGRVVETIRYAKPIGRNLVNLPYVADSRIQAAPSGVAGLPAGETVYLATDRDGFVGDWFAVKEGKQIDLSVEALAEKVSPSSLFGIGLYYSVDGVNFNAFNRTATLSNNGSTGGIVAGRLTVPAGYKYARVMVQLEGPWGQTGSRYFRNVEATRVGSAADLIPVKADLATLVKQQLLSSAADQRTRYVYDATNHPLYQQDPLGYITKTRYNATGQVIEKIRYANPLPTSTPATQAAFDASLAPDPTYDRPTRYVYDQAGQLRFTIDALGGVTESVYNAHGQVVRTIAYDTPITYTAVTDTSTAETVRALLPASILAARETITTYDATGRVLHTAQAQTSTATTKLFTVTENQYDAFGRLTRSVAYSTPVALQDLPAIPTAQQLADKLAPLANSAADRSTRYAYDAAGRLVQSTDGEGYTEQYAYDAWGRKSRYTNKNGAVFDYEYDAMGRLLAEWSPAVEVTRLDDALTPIADSSTTGLQRIQTRMSYDAWGQLLSRTQAHGRPEARTTRYEYDAMGRQVRALFQPVGVYDASTDDLASNGVSGTGVSRRDTLRSLVTETVYNAFGQAVASRDVSGNYSYKTYDKLGRLVNEIDANHHVTQHLYSARDGEYSQVARLGTAAAFTDGLGVSADTLDAAAATAAATSPGSTRNLRSFFDRLGRTQRVEDLLDAVYSHDSTSGQGGNWARATTYEYTVWGDLKARASLLDRAGPAGAANRSATTWFAYDLKGGLSRQVDAEGYVTDYRKNAFGEDDQVMQYASKIDVSTQGLAAQPTRTPAGNAGSTAAQGHDRITAFVYDRRGMQTSSRRLALQAGVRSDTAQPTPQLARQLGDLHNHIVYDGVGNALRTTSQWRDPVTGAVLGEQGATYSTYDALGRLVAVVAAESQDSARGRITTTRYDALGNAVLTRRYATLSPGNTASPGQPPAESADDQVTRQVFDSLGRVLQVRDALGNDRFVSYDAAGRAVKQWAPFADADGLARNAIQAFSYDNTGRQTETKTLVTRLRTDSHLFTTEAASYNAFGEITAKARDGITFEQNAYDNAGRLWKTNAGDGVFKIHWYDLQDNVTASFVSNSLALDLAHAATPDTLAATPAGQIRRTSNTYDKLQHVVRQQAPSVTHLDGTVTSDVTTQSLDAWGNVLAVWRNGSERVQYRYNSQNQAVEETQVNATSWSANGTSSTGNLTKSIYYDAWGHNIGNVDAAGNANAASYNFFGQIQREYHADAGQVAYSYDAFGRLSAKTDEVGRTYLYHYDKADREISRQVDVDAVGAGTAPYQLTQSSYNALGHKITETSGQDSAYAGAVRKYTYDARGLLVKSQAPGGQVTEFWYDAAGRKTRERDGNGLEVSWGYDSSTGRLNAHTDLGGATYSYTHANDGQVLTQTSSRGQALSYTYFGNGALKQLSDGYLRSNTQYDYDTEGNRNREIFTSDGKVYRDLTNLYDAQGRLVRATDKAAGVRQSAGNLYELNIGYDAVGNRRRVWGSAQSSNNSAGQAFDDWYTYDAMNRVRINGGDLAAGSVSEVSARGVYIYDAAGRRRQELTKFNSAAGVTGWRLKFSYDFADRLTQRDKVFLGSGFADGVRNQEKTIGYGENGVQTEIENVYDYNSTVNYKSRRTRITFNSNGQATHRQDYVIGKATTSSNGNTTATAEQATGDQVTTYDAAGNVSTLVVKGYGAQSGNMYDRQVRLTYEAANSTYQYSYVLMAGYKERGQSLTGQSRPYNGSWTTYVPSQSVLEYDANGNLAQVKRQSNGGWSTSWHLTDSAGHITRNWGSQIAYWGGTAATFSQDGSLKRWTPATGALEGAAGALAALPAAPSVANPDRWTLETTLYVNDQRMGGFRHYYSDDFDAESQTRTVDNEWGADIDISGLGSARKAEGSGQTYTAQAGDTARALAQRFYGDASLWYVIADANALVTLGINGNSDATLTEGQAVKIPNVVRSSNTPTSFAVYDPSGLIGDTAPEVTMPPPPPPPSSGGGCGGLGMILVVVVAVVATVLTAGAAAVAMGAVASGTGVVAAGTAVLTGGLAGATLTATASALTVAAAAAVGGAVGSIASQGVAMAMGMQTEFSWKQVGLGALGAAVTSGMGQAGMFSGLGQYGAAAANAAAGNAITQGLAVATDLQDKFNWRAVATSAMAAPVAQYLGAQAGGLVRGMVGGSAGQFAGDFAQRLTAGVVSQRIRMAVYNQGKLDYASIAADAFGNALGQGLVDAINSDRNPLNGNYRNEMDRESDAYSPVFNYNYRNGSDVESDSAYEARRVQEGSSQSDAIMGRRASEAWAASQALDRSIKDQALASRNFDAVAGRVWAQEDAAAAARALAALPAEHARADAYARQRARQAERARDEQLQASINAAPMSAGLGGGAGPAYGEKPPVSAVVRAYFRSVTAEGPSERPGMVATFLGGSSATFLRSDIGPAEQRQIAGLHNLSLSMTAAGTASVAGAPALIAAGEGTVAVAGEFVSGARALYNGVRAFVVDVATHGPWGAYLLNGNGVNTVGLLATEMAIGYEAVSPSPPVLGSAVRKTVGIAAEGWAAAQAERAALLAGDGAGAAGQRGLTALQSRTGKLAGVAEFDQLFANSPQAPKMLNALARRGINVVDDASRLDAGVAAQVFRDNGQLNLVYDSNGTTFVDMLHETRHVAQVQRIEVANVLGEKDIFSSARLIGAAERGAYEYEIRLGRANGFSSEYMSYLQKQIDEYYPPGYSKKFNASPSMKSIFNAMEPGLKP